MIFLSPCEELEHGQELQIWAKTKIKDIKHLEWYCYRIGIKDQVRMAGSNEFVLTSMSK